jgi:hypothetical protein
MTHEDMKHEVVVSEFLSDQYFVYRMSETLEICPRSKRAIPRRVTYAASDFRQRTVPVNTVCISNLSLNFQILLWIIFDVGRRFISPRFIEQSIDVKFSCNGDDALSGNIVLRNYVTIERN